MGQFIDLTGQKFGRLTVINRGDDYISPKGYRSATWDCECSCGNKTTVRGIYLRNGKTVSCGCLRKDYPNRVTHNESKTKLYAIWSSLRSRCKDKKDADYGGRGIFVCNEWNNSYILFRNWALENGYKDFLSIDRINNDDGYYPENCRWVDDKVQGNNKRSNHLLTYNGKTMTVSQWSDYTGIKYKKILERINKCNWDVERTLTTP